MRLKLKEGVKRHLRVRLKDSTGTVWRKVLKTDRKQVWKATAKQLGTRTVTIRMKRSDGRVFRRAVAYTVTASSDPHADADAHRHALAMPAPLMGVSSSSNDHGGQMAWDSWRVYTVTTLHQIANRQGELRPQAMLYSKQSDPLGRHLPGHLRQRGGRPQRVLLLDRQHPLGAVGDQGLLVQRQRDVQQGDAGHHAAQADGDRRPSSPPSAPCTTPPPGRERPAPLPRRLRRLRPDHRAGARRDRGGLAASHDPLPRLRGLVDLPGRPQGHPRRPDLQLGLDQPADANVAPHGYMVRCFERVKQALDAAGMPRNAVSFHVGETGTGDDPDDPTTRPYWAVHGFMHPLVTSARLRHPAGHRELVGRPAGRDLPAEHPADEDPATPSTREAWQNWHLYDHLRGGTLPRPGGEPECGLEDHGYSCDLRRSPGPPARCPLPCAGERYRTLSGTRPLTSGSAKRRGLRRSAERNALSPQQGATRPDA